MRAVFLWLARNQWLKTRLPRLWFMRRRPSLHAGRDHGGRAPRCRATPGRRHRHDVHRLGENLTSLDEAEAVADHYVELVDRIVAEGIDGEVSVKPTQLGLDLDADACTSCWCGSPSGRRRRLVPVARHGGQRLL